MTDDESKKIKVELDHEQKVIHLGCWFYDLKGVLIAEATEEDQKKYYCGKFMTYPIVDDNWKVREDECIRDGISDLVVGKKGETIYFEYRRETMFEKYYYSLKNGKYVRLGNQTCKLVIK